MTHDKAIYHGVVDGVDIYHLCQVDDFALASPSEDIAKSVYDKLGCALQLDGRLTTIQLSWVD